MMDIESMERFREIEARLAKLEEKFEEPEEEIKTYSIGDKFIRERNSGEDETYILAESSANGDGVGLICLEDGKLWFVPASVDDKALITEAEFIGICGGTYNKEFDKIAEEE